MSLDSVYVVFERSDTKHIVKPFIDKDINHCYLLIPQGKTLIAYNKTIGNTEIYTINKINDILRDNIVIKTTPTISSNIFMINSCVGHVKRFLGLNKPFIWTPYQLMRYLQNG